MRRDLKLITFTLSNPKSTQGNFKEEIKINLLYVLPWRIMTSKQINVLVSYNIFIFCVAINDTIYKTVWNCLISDIFIKTCLPVLLVFSSKYLLTKYYILIPFETMPSNFTFEELTTSKWKRISLQKYTRRHSR